MEGTEGALLSSTSPSSDSNDPCRLNEVSFKNCSRKDICEAGRSNTVGGQNSGTMSSLPTSYKQTARKKNGERKERKDKKKRDDEKSLWLV